jgi:hypothetical protein
MHHELKISFGEALDRPFHVQCSCGTAGDFENHELAVGYVAMHTVRLQGINSASYVDETVTPLAVPKKTAEKTTAK